MDTPFPGGGQPSSYTRRLTSEAEQQPSCVSELVSMEAYYTSSPMAHEKSPQSTEAPPSTMYLQHPYTFLSHSPTAFPSMTSDPQYHPMAHHAWPSPPSGPEDFDNYSYGSSPTCGSSQTGYNHSPVSPRTWPSPHHPFQQPDSLESLQICTPTSIGSLPAHGSQTLTSYTEGFGRSFELSDADVHGMSYDSSPSTTYDFGKEALSGTASPVDLSLDGPAYMAITGGDKALPGNPPSSLARSRPRETSSVVSPIKGEEPYAQLIYRAFMSRPDHCMSLQDIYQWFRDNTDKAKSDNKGWQNSIRHNLSMNLAFLKRERKQTSPAPITIVGDRSTPSSGSNSSKRSTEWMLADWAVRNGVQSTTRYRKGNPTRSGRGHGGRITSHGFQHEYQHNGNRIPARSASGRKGGCAASRAKLHRHYSQGTHMSSAMTMPLRPLIVGPQIPMPSVYPLQYGNEQMPLCKVETPPQVMVKPEPAYSPLTPETSAPDSFSLMLPESSFDPHTQSSNASHNATCALVNEDQGMLYTGPSQYKYPYGAPGVTEGYYGECRRVSPPANPPVSAGGDGGHHFGMIDSESYEWSANVSL